MTIAGAQQSPPTFRAALELFTIKVQVVADRGKPLPSLTADEFDIRINRRRRALVFVESIRYDDGGTADIPIAPQPNDTKLASNDDKFFKPFKGQASAVYLLGLETIEAERSEMVRVSMRHKGVTARRWAWCGIPAKCRPATPPANSR